MDHHHPLCCRRDLGVLTVLRYLLGLFAIVFVHSMICLGVFFLLTVCYGAHVAQQSMRLRQRSSVRHSPILLLVDPEDCSVTVVIDTDSKNVVLPSMPGMKPLRCPIHSIFVVSHVMTYETSDLFKDQIVKQPYLLRTNYDDGKVYRISPSTPLQLYLHSDSEG